MLKASGKSYTVYSDIFNTIFVSIRLKKALFLSFTVLYFPFLPCISVQGHTTKMSAEIPAALPTAASTAGANDDDDDDDDMHHFIGTVKGAVVGVQHYRGIISKKEMLEFRREPKNKYDTNAIAVHNSAGDMVGHVPREIAATMAPLMDRNYIIMEAKTGTAVSAKYKLGVEFSVFCIERKRDYVSKALKGCYHVGFNASAAPPPPEAGGPTGSSQSTQSTLVEGLWSLECAPEPFVDLADPTATFKGTLMPYQRYGLTWMLEREKVRKVLCSDGPETPSLIRSASMNTNSALVRKKSATAPPPKGKAAAGKKRARDDEEDKAVDSGIIPFWAKDPKSGLYQNLLTNFSTPTLPDAPRGGILADEMGLGKTIQILSLISHPVCDAKGKAMTDVATLLVCPMSLLPHWEGHIQDFLPGVEVMTYHGPNRRTAMDITKCRGVVLTSYTVLRSEGSDPNGRLMSTQWGRVVLDEAHNIKRGATATSKAAVQLKAYTRWAMTGTPIQNHLDDLQALVAFLHVDVFQLPSMWQRLVSRPIRESRPEAIPRLQSLVRTFCLRRTKGMEYEGKPLVSLPTITTNLVTIKFTESELDEYNRLKDSFGKCIASWKEQEEKGTGADPKQSSRFAQALVLLLRLRQFCNHPSLVPDLAKLLAGELPHELVAAAATLGVDAKVRAQATLDALRNDACPICMDVVSRGVVTNCFHVFCHDCITTLVEQGTNVKCPLCRAAMGIALIEELNTAAVNDSVVKQSSKLDKVVDIIKETQAAGKKCVIFSQWPSMLKCIEGRLSPKTSACLNGSMNLAQRRQALDTFNSDPAINVMLLSTMAGGTGLNLTVATTVVLVDPWWNPAVDQQAIMRVHRVGQKQPVQVYRLVMEDSVETNMLALQGKKEALAAGALGGVSPGQNPAAKLTLDDLRRLF